MAEVADFRIPEFSFATRAQALARQKDELFDLLIVGGGITGAAAARDASARGMRVALVEREDFATGTSSRSSKLIHGGVRYLENLEFGLVFEALAERALLLKTVPHMVRPLPFYMAVYRGDAHSRALLNLGLWLYDLLALFRTPEFHRSFSRDALLREIPFLKSEGLTGGLKYFDASMWDDVLVVETARAAATLGAAIATYTEAVSPLREGERVTGFRCRDRESGAEFDLRAHQTVICGGPWTDELGRRLKHDWKPWLTPSKGVHLIFDLKRIPVPGALVMSHPEDGRISFVIPRPDYGAGVVIVGTTDSPSPADPAQVGVTQADVDYLMNLLRKYFPSLDLKDTDILSAYAGVRPLFGPGATGGGAATLQKVSREHHIGEGPGGTLIVAGGKYTTHRKMAEEIVDASLKAWRKHASAGRAPAVPTFTRRGSTKSPVNPAATAAAMKAVREASPSIPEKLVSRYGVGAVEIATSAASAGAPAELDGFPALEGQLRFSLRHEMVLHLDDFVLRRAPLFAARADHGRAWYPRLAQIWAEARGLDTATELRRLEEIVALRSRWSSA